MDDQEHISILEQELVRLTAALDRKDAQLTALAEVVEVSEKILRAHKSGNNGAYNGEAVLCKHFENMLTHALAKLKGAE